MNQEKKAAVRVGLVRRPGKLTTLADVRVELAYIYRQARTGVIPMRDATSLTFMLATLGKLIVESELESRVYALEERLERRLP